MKELAPLSRKPTLAPATKDELARVITSTLRPTTADAELGDGRNRRASGSKPKVTKVTEAHAGPANEGRVNIEVSLEFLTILVP